jgi:dipeptidyl aminopeptidase/acylaminoacyl peptidase
MKKIILALSIPIIILASEYKIPPKAIADIVDAPLTPTMSLSPNKVDYLILSRSSLPSIEELSAPELRLAGVRINPAMNARSRRTSYTGAKLHQIGQSRSIPLKGLPNNAKIHSFSWSPDGKSIALAVSSNTDIHLYIANVKTGKSKMLLRSPLNLTYGAPFVWRSDSQSLIVKSVPERRGIAPKRGMKPSGPTTQENLGKIAPARTYQDLLQSSYDEALFDFYFTSQIIDISIKGKKKLVGKPGIVKRIDPSPNGNYTMIQIIHKPYSYIVPINRFPFSTQILDKKGRLIKELRDTPLAETIPIGRDAVLDGARSFRWRSDEGATIFYAEALDGGDPRKKVSFRDELFLLKAPFSEPQSMLKTKLRFNNVMWGDSKTALISTRKWSERRQIVMHYNSDSKESFDIIDRLYEDRYNDPGTPMMEMNSFGRPVLVMNTTNNERKLYMSGIGASPKGDLPFVDEFEISSQSSTRLWRCESPFYERVISMVDKNKKIFITSREAKDLQPNYFLRNLSDNTDKALTAFPHPYPQMKGLYKEMLTYKRNDGVDLSATIYLPSGRKPGDGPLPLLVWAYPREFKTSKAASQVVGSPHRFSRISPTSPLVMLSYGYAVLMGATMPIIGEGDSEPNDRFVQQLVSSAQAAVDLMVEKNITTRDQVAIGGHSYGAFMTANLLSHSDIFQAGIARSGAYNRSLTPFGFQSEQRTFWEAPEIYFAMSPFMHAHKVNEPILLIHGEVDNNSGTFPVQSKRYYHALKGHGATTRLVMLPHESHGYRARESIMHMLWETASWLDKYVKKDQKD